MPLFAHLLDMRRFDPVHGNTAFSWHGPGFGGAPYGPTLNYVGAVGGSQQAQPNRLHNQAAPARVIRGGPLDYGASAYAHDARRRP